MPEICQNYQLNTKKEKKKKKMMMMEKKKSDPFEAAELLT